MISSSMMHGAGLAGGLLLSLSLAFFPLYDELRGEQGRSETVVEASHVRTEARRSALPVRVEQDVVASERHVVASTRPREARIFEGPVDLRTAMTSLEVIQERRDARMGTERHTITKKTLREAMEDLEVIHRHRPCNRRRRKKSIINLVPVATNGSESAVVRPQEK